MFENKNTDTTNMVSNFNELIKNKNRSNSTKNYHSGDTLEHKWGVDKNIMSTKPARRVQYPVTEEFKCLSAFWLHVIFI